VRQVFATVWLQKGKVTAIKANKNYALLVEAAARSVAVAMATSAGVEYAPATLLPFPLWRAFREAAMLGKA
jgi:hypothetical protein